MLRLVALLVLSTLNSIAFAANLLQFDVGGLVITRTSTGNISGYYVGRSDESYISKKGDAIHVCQFLFHGLLIDKSEAKLSAWEVALIPPQENRRASGAIYIQDDRWIIQFRPIPNGCRSKPDGDQFAVRSSSIDDATPTEEQGLHAKLMRTTPVLGIRVSKTRAPIKIKPSAASKIIQEAAPGDIFVTFGSQGKYSRIRHIDGETGRIVEGWMETAALVDPFPSH
ncbi:hypothetical protein [Ideonella sp. YS5]|uniref:hypothetical protein n=1 Tax=Ideonella sp. YS5 TaxID=3453714 RepID=UPI003EE9E758